MPRSMKWPGEERPILTYRTEPNDLAPQRGGKKEEEKKKKKMKETE